MAEYRGVPCEPGTLCEVCSTEYANNAAFRYAMDKGKRDRARSRKVKRDRRISKLSGGGEVPQGQQNPTGRARVLKR